MVMNILEPELCPPTSYSNGNLGNSPNVNKEFCHLDMMFNSNSFDPFKNQFNSMFDYILGSDRLVDSNINQTASLNSNTHIGSALPSNNNINNSDSNIWDQQWSLGDGLPNSFGSVSPLNESPSTVSPGMQHSRLIHYMNNFNSVSNNTPKSVSPSDVPTSQLEAMKVHDFMNSSLGSTSPITNELPVSSNKDNYFGPNSISFSPHDGAESLFSDFLNTLGADKKDPVDSNAEGNVWDSFNYSLSKIDLNVENTSAMPKNAWSKPLKFKKESENDNLNSREKPSPMIPKKPPTQPPVKPRASPPSVTISSLKHEIQPPPKQSNSEPSPFKASIGSKISQLDDFDIAVSTKLAKQTKASSDFQIVGNRKTKSFKNTKPSNVEKCSYGIRCLFGVECTRWHSNEDLEAFNKQKLPNGVRKCPWAGKCFRKLKCINHHTEKEIEQFSKDAS